jgi:RNA polymerase sigma factor (sigma-70 family)
VVWDRVHRRDPVRPRQSTRCIREYITGCNGACRAARHLGGIIGSPAASTVFVIDPATSDAELLALCRAGRQAAWSTLVRRYQRLIYTVPRRAGLDEAAAADVFQTCFARLFEHLDRIDDASRIRAWLVTTARRETLRWLESQRRIVDLAPAGGDAADGGDDAPDPLDQIAADQPLTEQWLEDVQQHDRLRRAVELLDPRARQFVELVFLQDEPPSYQEIAQALGIAEGSIGPTRARCLAKLRTILARMNM